MKKLIVFLLLASSLMARPYRYDPYAPFTQMFGAFWQWTVGTRAFLPPSSGSLCGSSAHCYSLTYNSTLTGSANSSNFTALVSGSGSAFCTVANGGYVNSSTGADIEAFTTNGFTTQLPSELEYYQGSATCSFVLWVQIPTLSATTNGTIYLALGNASPPARTPNPWDIYSGGVWHFPNGAALSLADSTTNAHNGTEVNSPSAATGKIDGGMSLSSASSQMVTLGYSGSLVLYQTASFSAWVNPNSATAGNTRSIIGGSGTGDQYLELRVTGTNTINALEQGVASLCTSAGSVPNGSWSYVGFTWDGTTCNIYINGAQSVSTTVSGSFNAGAGEAYQLGKGYGTGENFDGLLDEVHESNSTIRSASWYLAEYNNQNAPGNVGSPGFWTWSLLQ
jgi:hypothetical protein